MALAKVYLTDPKTRKRTAEFAANASLISAAPEMLQELIKGRHLAWQEASARAPGELGRPYLDNLVASMDRVIAKATTIQQ